MAWPPPGPAPGACRLAAARFLGFLCAAAPAVATGEQVPDPEGLERGYHVTVDVQLVSLNVAALDRRGRYRTDLGPGDFRLMVDGRPTPIEHVSLTEDEPLDLAVLLDVSGSMRFDRKIDRSRWVIRQLLGEVLRPGDRAALLTFADGRIEVPLPFTRDREAYSAALGALEAYGKTALGDALAEAAALVAEEGQLTPALVLLTDGYDNASRQSLSGALARLRSRGVPVYPLAVVAPHVREEARHPDAGSDLELLQRIATETGGRFFVVTSPASMLAATRAIETDLRSRYRLEFSPPGKPKQSGGGRSAAQTRPSTRPRHLTLTTPRKGFELRYRRAYQP